MKKFTYLFIILSCYTDLLHAALPAAQKSEIQKESQALLTKIIKLKREQETEVYQIHLAFIKRSHALREKKIESEYRLLRKKEFGNHKKNEKIEQDLKKTNQEFKQKLKETREQYLGNKLKQAVTKYKEKIAHLTKQFREKIKEVPQKN